MKFLLIALLFLTSCSTVSEDGFLNQVMGKIAYDTDSIITKRGEFSSDGREFNFVGGTIPIKIYKAKDQNTAYYIEKKTGVTTRYKFSINGNELTIDAENGQPPNTLYLNN